MCGVDHGDGTDARFAQAGAAYEGLAMAPALRAVLVDGRGCAIRCVFTSLILGWSQSRLTSAIYL